MFKLIQIGSVENNYHKLKECPANGYSSENISIIKIDNKFLLGMKGLSKGMKLHVLWYFDKASRKILSQKISVDSETIGVFAMRSPQRPNPIALSLCEIIDIEDNKIYVKGLECLNNSKIIDIKKAINYEEVGNILL